MIFDRAAIIGAVLFAGIGLVSISTAMVFKAQRDTARAAYAVLEQSNRRTVAALAEATQQHLRDLEAIGAERQRERAAQAELATRLEALRNDPTHDAHAADVLGRAVDLLRQPGAGGGGADPAPGAAPGPAGVR